MYQLLRKRLAGKRGFTLIELIVVIAVIAILAVILIPRFTGFTQSARQKSALSDARNILMTLEALEASGKLGFTDAADATELAALTTAVNTYMGKDILVANASELTAAKRTGTKLEFTYVKTVGGTAYSVVYNGSAFTIDGEEVQG